MRHYLICRPNRLRPDSEDAACVVHSFTEIWKVSEGIGLHLREDVQYTLNEWCLGRTDTSVPFEHVFLDHG